MAPDTNKNLIPDAYEPLVSSLLMGAIGVLGSVGSYYKLPWMALVIAGVTALGVAFRLIRRNGGEA